MRDKGGRGSKNPYILREVIFGWSLTAEALHDEPSDSRGFEDELIRHLHCTTVTAFLVLILLGSVSSCRLAGGGRGR